MVGFSEAQKIQTISKVFADSSKSPMSVVVVDNIERLLGEWKRSRFILSPKMGLRVTCTRLDARGPTLFKCGAAGPHGTYGEATS